MHAPGNRARRIRGAAAGKILTDRSLRSGKIIMNRKRRPVPWLLCWLLSGLAACQPESAPRELSQIKILRGAHQTALPGQPFPQAVFLELTGKAKSGFPGSNRPERGIAGLKVKLKPAAGSELTVSSVPTRTTAVCGPILTSMVR